MTCNPNYHSLQFLIKRIRLFLLEILLLTGIYFLKFLKILLRGYYNAIVGKKYLVFVIDTRYNENTYVSMTGINILLQSPVISAGTIDSGSHGSGYMVVGIATDTNISCGYTGYALIIVQLD